LQELETILKNTAADASVVTRGIFSLKKGTPRQVHFYDSPGHCWLRHHSLTLRLRKPFVLADKGGNNAGQKPNDNSQEEDDDDTDATTDVEENGQDEWEGMLKSRSGDRYHTTARQSYIQGCHASVRKGKHKFEEDIGHFEFLANVYSFSQKCHFTTRMTRQRQQRNNSNTNSILSTLKDIADTWGEPTHELLEQQLNLELSTPLQLVGNQSLIEVAYENFYLELEEDAKKDQIAEAKLTLWYAWQGGGEEKGGDDDTDTDQDFASSSLLLQPPIVAELSSRIKSKHEAWSDTSILRMHTYWEGLGKILQEQKWIDFDKASVTKTSWIYESNNDRFCSLHQQEGDSNEDA